ncbi:MAG: hypothetical protein PHS86_10625 [Syntrophaceae bacterium]|nr:hypothetical protein [Syntrophaceae bacterium]
MKRNIFLLLVVVIFSGACTTIGPSKGDLDKQYSATATVLSDFSYKIVGYYQDQKLDIPKDFDASQFYDVLKNKYPDQTSVQYVWETYKVLARSVEGGYSAMLCDRKTDTKIMEDLSCHLSRVEIRSWQSGLPAMCEFENNWKKYCE